MLDSAELQRRRQALYQQLGQHGIAIIPAAAVQIRSRDTEHPYRQDSDFAYLTGFPEPDAVAVFAPGREQGEYMLFCRERDPAMEQWHGYRAGQAGAVASYGADQAFPIAELNRQLPALLEGREQLYYALGRDKRMDRRITHALRQLREQSRRGLAVPAAIVAPETLVHEMRQLKSEAELTLLREAAAISVRAHERAMRACQPGLREYQLAAELQHEFAVANGCPAYGSIVGGGANACVLHYLENSAKLQDGELVLIDAAAEYRGYCADITRSFPVNGRYSPAQKALYEVVLAAQLAAIEAVQVGNSFNAPHEAAVDVLVQGLLDLKLLAGTPEEVKECGSYRRFYMHSTSHWLGGDVHDVGAYKDHGQWRALQAGMVLTVEPGLYIPDAEDIPAAMRGIGIRIEDDVHVSAAGPEVLTAALGKRVAEVEALCQQ